MKRLLPLIVLIIFTHITVSQEVPDSIVRIDSTSTIQQRIINEDLNKKYVGDEFNYETKTGESQNLLSRFLRWIGQGLRSIFGINISPEALKIMEYLVYILMGGLVVYLLIRVLINEKFNTIFTKKAKTIFDIDLAEQHIESLDLDSLLKSSLQESNYRLAIRYHFLKILKQLSQKEIIEWHFDKTNTDYQQEITSGPIQSNFKKSAYLYDYIWYGEQPIDEKKYQKAADTFMALSNLIST